jgi:glycosyltransferase involved in cell wall biosynthesis
MKIGLILDKLDYGPSGIGDYEYNLTKQLLVIDKENDYTLIHIKTKNQQSSYHDVFTRGKEIVVNQIKFPSILVERIINKRFIMPRILKKEEFDLIHEMSHIIPMTYFSSFKFITVYDIFYYSPQRKVLDKSNKFNLSLFFRLLNMYFLQRLLKNHPIHIIAISEYSKQEIIKYLKISENRITVIYEGVDHERYKQLPKNEIMKKYNIPEDYRIILYVGSEQPRKNLPSLIKAFHKLKKKHDNVKLLKVGNPQWKGAREELRKLIKELILQNDVIFTGHVPEEDLPKIYNAADLFVFPSLYEGGFGLPALEAMACGCPVITSNIPQLVETVGSDTGIMIDPYDVDGLARAMYEVLTNDSLRENIIEKGLERAKKFTWEKAAEETLKVYKEVMEQSI